MIKKSHKIVSLLLTLVMLLGLVPGMNVFAAQINEYVDPADVWITSNGRSNELDFNATVTQETIYCCVCGRETVNLTYRVPEYTKSGETALNRGVKYSDGTMTNGVTKGNVDDGVPGVDATYTTYHWTKAICQICGTINSVDGEDAYNFNKNVYALNSCDHAFFLDFDNTTHEPYNDTYHTTVLKKGQYCQFCKGTQARASENRERHNFIEMVDGQVGNNRFYVSETCEDCGYQSSEYVSAKSVVSAYYGVEDGEPHTLTVSDLSDRGVNTSIRYGNTASNCNLTSAPNYTKPGYYNVYYEITYSYDGEKMVENGVSYVWILEDDSKENGGIIIIPPQTHVHDYNYLETVKPTCTTLGYDRFQCSGCGDLIKTNYEQSLGHEYKTVVVREASCTQSGLELHMCTKCGDFYEVTTPKTAHHYITNICNPTCAASGYEQHICEDCGTSYTTNVTPALNHNFTQLVKQPTCTEQGYTTVYCTRCGAHYVTEYTKPLGHSWDEGHVIAAAGCTADGVIEYNCRNCDEKMIKGESAIGHTPGEKATCDEPQVCTVCGAVLELPHGHTYASKEIAPTCTEMGYTEYKCRFCDDAYTAEYTDIIPHDYDVTVIPATCTSMGYSVYTCEDCGHEYKSDYTDKLAHNYKANITNPTCTELGFTEFVCEDCGDSYISDYKDKLPHNYNKKEVEPTCTEDGYTIYECPDCGASYIGDYVDEKEHNYVETVVPPTCTELGYSEFVCSDCGTSYKGNYVDKAPHDYKATVHEPTCTAFGYTEYHCKNCTANYLSDYVDKKAHYYIENVVAPTCTELGYTIFTCADCSDSYKGAYVEPNGHTPSEWIIDLETSITSAGEKHIECTVCGEVLKRVAIPQLVAKDRTDEDGRAVVGKYSIEVCRENGDPIFDSVVAIDVFDNISIVLPDERLLDFGDRTKILVTYTEDETAASDVNIFIVDGRNNNVTGKTDAKGILIVPNSNSSTGDDNGTIGGEVDDANRTYVVTVTNKENVVIDNCDIRIGESNDIVVDLPDGLILTEDSPAIITVLDQNGNPQNDVSIIVIGDRDYIEKGKTDVYGKLTVPNVFEGYTDKDGRAHVNGHNVFVADEVGIIENAFVKMNEDGSVEVTLPEDDIIDYHNRTTVSIYDRMGIAIKDIPVTVKETSGKEKSGVTDETGRMTVPPLNEDYTDSKGAAKVSGYDVIIVDETAPIVDALVYYDEEHKEISVALPIDKTISYDNRVTITVSSEGAPTVAMPVAVMDYTELGECGVTDEEGKVVVYPLNKDMTDSEGKARVNDINVHIADSAKNIAGALVVMNEDGTISVVLPAENVFAVDNRIKVTLTDTENAPVKDVLVDVTDSAGTKEKDMTNKDGIAQVPPINSDITDKNGYAEVNAYSVTVENQTGKVENAKITLSEDGKIAVELPENVLIDYSNRVTVTVSNRADGTLVKDIDVTVSDTAERVMAGKTDENGKIIVPPMNEDMTDDKGDSDVEETKPGQGEDTDGDGKEDKPGENQTTSYKVTVSDTKGVIANALVKIEDGRVSVTLPDTHTLTTSNQTTVLVADNEGNAKSGVSVTVTDKNKATATQTTNSIGKIVVPVKSTGGGGGSSRPSSGGGGGGGYSVSTVNVKVVDKDGKNVSVTKSIGTDKVTLTLPTGKNLEKDDNYYTITVTDRSGNAKAGYNVTLKDKNENEVSGTTDKKGVITLPGEDHAAYIVGYPDGTFRPDGDMERAEAAAIFARLIAERKGEKISGKASFKDVESNAWYASYVGYMEKYGVIKGYNDGMFRANDKISRAEFTTMAVRYYDLFEDVDTKASTVKYDDVTSSHWASSNIAFATNEKWLNGYAGNVFRPDVNITRAEVVTVINRMLGRYADEEYVDKNLSVLNQFTDVKNNEMWYFYQIAESANDHKAVTNSDGEIWID